MRHIVFEHIFIFSKIHQPSSFVNLYLILSPANELSLFFALFPFNPIYFPCISSYFTDILSKCQNFLLTYIEKAFIIVIRKCAREHIS